ncbi:MAG TPA: nucleotide exchange factor GrpE [Candidatus Competibacter sp.]|nr:nucleotide exchange factor GrpE [Candidatus Competibacteraceae bacterium]HPE71887.1 nucleotide exchange factor GrpE [Candidatus Competibacter sp.]HRW66329.1 nucleotide exchange factor GrpE [Candidatus Competibacter sp.]
MSSTEPKQSPPTRPDVAGADTQPSVETTLAVEEEGAELSISHEEFEGLQRELDQALAKADEHWKLYLGAHAEMENLRKRAEREVQNAHKFALERFFGELLPVRDSLELGLAAASDAVDIAKLREGVELTLRQLTTAMEKFGAREVDPLGAKFDPGQQEAMAMLPTDQAEPNTVVQVVQKGYLLNERLIRPAKVIVAQAVPRPAG